jgi:hypothetical protein
MGNSFFLRIAKGLVERHVSVYCLGRNADVDTGTEDVWSGGGIFTPPTAARVHHVSSGSASDTALGAGARTVRVSGLDGNYQIASEVVTLSGTTPVSTTGAYTFVSEVCVLTAGSDGTNVGNITATAATDNTISASVVAGTGKSLTAAYQIPAGYTGYLQSVYGGVHGQSGAGVELTCKVKPFGGVFVPVSSSILQPGGGSMTIDAWDCPIVLPAKSIVKVSATSDTNNVLVHAAFNLILVKA